MKFVNRIIGAAIFGGFLSLAGGAYAGGPVTVTVEKEVLAFNPQVVEIRKGESIRWINHDVQPHFLAASKSSEKLESLTTQGDLLLFKTLEPGETYDQSISDVGAFFYYCGIHPQMWGRIIVKE
ncbi:MAG: cupredoxin domain-containing protein [Nitrospirae bacterium]|nr:cupredoxin domain-containing protein [Nitrospirota bacterium]